jgi:putative alpha-1,2-mannosidase
MDYGYVSQDVVDDSTSLTLSFAFDDYLLGKISEYTGDTASAQAAFKRSKNYANIWSPESALFCPKYANGTLECPATGKSPWSWTVFREGDAYHWSWFVPHDPAGLIALYPSVDAYTSALEAFFANHVANNDKFGNELPNPYYWAGNEHDFFAPFMFSFAGNGACTRTQYWTRRLVPMHFSNTPHGIPGNEDYGSMSSWVLFASLGLFPQAGTSRFMISSPSVTNASIKLSHVTGPVPFSKLEIVSYNNTVMNTYVQKLVVNGVEHTEAWVDRAVLASPKGCRLEYFMSDAASSALCPTSSA